MSGRVHQQRGGGGGAHARKPFGRGAAAAGGEGSHNSSSMGRRGWRRGAWRGGAAGAAGGAKATEEKSSSTSEQRWDCLRTLIVTIGDEVALIPQQIQRLAREAENAVMRWREEEAEQQQQQGQDGAPPPASGSDVPHGAAPQDAAAAGPAAAAAGTEAEGAEEGSERGDAVAGVQRRVQLLPVPPRVKQEPRDEDEGDREEHQRRGLAGENARAAGAAGERRLVKTENDYSLYSLHQSQAGMDGVAAGAAALQYVHEERLAELLVKCASQLPLKIGIYASLLGLWYKKSRMRPLCYRVVHGSLRQLEESFKEGDFSKVTLLLRFFIALAGSFVLRVESVFELLKSLLSFASAVPAGATTEHLLLSTLSSLPWISMRLYEQQRSTMDAVVALAHEAAAAAAGSSPEQLLLQQATLPIRVPPPAVTGSSSAQNEAAASLASLGLHQTRLDSLLDALASMVEGGWRSQATLRFYQSAELYPLLRPSAATAAAPCTLPALSLQAADLRAVRVSPLQRVLRLPVSIEKIDLPLASHDRWILEDYILTIFRNFRKNVALCAEQLLRVPVEHEQFEFVLVECLFSELFQLPHAPLVQDVGDASFLVARVLHRVSQLQNSLVAVVEAVLTSLVRHAAYFDYNTTRVLANFFAYWLNAWGGPSRLLEEWLGLSIPPACVKAFVRLALDKAFRLRYREELISLLPACVEPYWPPNPLPECPYTAGEEQQPQALGDESGDAEAAAATTYVAGVYEFRFLHDLLLFSFDHVSFPLPRRTRPKTQGQQTQEGKPRVSDVSAPAAASVGFEEEMQDAQRETEAGEEQQQQQEEEEGGVAALGDDADGAVVAAVHTANDGADEEEKEEEAAETEATGDAEQENGAAAAAEAEEDDTSDAAAGAAREATSCGKEGGDGTEERPAAAANWDAADSATDDAAVGAQTAAAAAAEDEEEEEPMDEATAAERAARYHYREVAAFFQERLGKKPWRRSLAAVRAAGGYAAIAAGGYAAGEAAPQANDAAAFFDEEERDAEEQDAEEEEKVMSAAGEAGADATAADYAKEDGSQRQKKSQQNATASPWGVRTLAEVFVYALLSKGVKTLTHTDRLVQNYSPVLRFLAAGASDEALPALLEAPAKRRAAENERAAGRQAAAAAAAAMPNEAAGTAGAAGMAGAAAAETVPEEAQAAETQHEMAAEWADLGDAAAANEDDEKGAVAVDPAVEDAILQTIFNYWRNSSQKTVLTVQQFYMRGVVPKESIIRFVFENLSPEERDDSRVMEVVEKLLQFAIDDARTKTAAARVLSEEAQQAHALSPVEALHQQETARRNAAAAATAAAENLVHLVLDYFMRELLNEEHPVRRGTLQARLLYVSRDYASHINVSALHEQLSDILCPEVEQFLAVTYQVQQHYHFLHNDRVEPEVATGAAAAARAAAQAQQAAAAQHQQQEESSAAAGQNGSSSMHEQEDNFSAPPVLAA